MKNNKRLQYNYTTTDWYIGFGLGIKPEWENWSGFTVIRINIILPFIVITFEWTWYTK